MRVFHIHHHLPLSKPCDVDVLPFVQCTFILFVYIYILSIIHWMLHAFKMFFHHIWHIYSLCYIKVCILIVFLFGKWGFPCARSSVRYEWCSRHTNDILLPILRSALGQHIVSVRRLFGQPAAVLWHSHPVGVSVHILYIYILTTPPTSFGIRQSAKQHVPSTAHSLALQFAARVENRIFRNRRKYFRHIVSVVATSSSDTAQTVCLFIPYDDVYRVCRRVYLFLESLIHQDEPKKKKKQQINIKGRTNNWRRRAQTSPYI